jgi:hypothetical protein
VNTPKSKNLDIYGHEQLPWSRAQAQLESGAGGTYWIATMGLDGRPHLTGFGGVWEDSKVYLVSGPVRNHARHGMWRGQRRAARRHSLAVRLIWAS